MNEEEKKAIEEIKEMINYIDKNGNMYCDNEDRDNVQILLNLLDKKDKVIDLMSELLCGIDVMNELGKESWNWNKEQMKEYFYKKVEEENDD